MSSVPWVLRISGYIAHYGAMVEGISFTFDHPGSDEGGERFVATYTGSYGLRKMVWRFARTPPALVTEDVAEIGIHFAKITAGAPDDAWVTGDHTTIETAATALWTSAKTKILATTALSEYRWYLAGPSHPAPQPGFRTVAVGAAGTMAAGNGMLPPQVAESITFKTTSRRHWGRVYWPAVYLGAATDSGTIATARVDELAGYWVTFFNACRAAGLYPVVYNRLLGSSLSVDTIQVDDLFDVVRRRRWKQPSYRKVTALT